MTTSELKIESVLFVCLGNICRSPTGEGVLKSLVSQTDLQSRIVIDSAGTAGYHVGAEADSRMREHAAKRGFGLTSRARKFTRDDLSEFDLVIPMDQENLRDILSLVDDPSSHRAEIKLLSDFLEGDWPTDVPDPYYGGAAGFEYVLDMIEAACPAIIQHCITS